MSDILPWSDLYATGYHAVDADHKGLFALINDLHEKVQEGFDPDSIGVTIGALEYYVQNHFAREEELMKGQRYAGLDDHVLSIESWKVRLPITGEPLTRILPTSI